jgi:hypothetical protein
LFADLNACLVPRVPGGGTRGAGHRPDIVSFLELVSVREGWTVSPTGQRLKTNTLLLTILSQPFDQFLFISDKAVFIRNYVAAVPAKPLKRIFVFDFNSVQAFQTFSGDAGFLTQLPSKTNPIIATLRTMKIQFLLVFFQFVAVFSILILHFLFSPFLQLFDS